MSLAPSSFWSCVYCVTFAQPKMKRGSLHITSNPFYQVFVLLIAFGVLMIAGSVYSHETVAADQTEQGTDGEESEKGLKLSIQEAVTHTVQVSVAFQSFLIVVLPELKEVKYRKNTSNWLPLANAKQIRVLFRLIISPNAP